jgi:hypothetical protein
VSASPLKQHSQARGLFRGQVHAEKANVQRLVEGIAELPFIRVREVQAPCAAHTGPCAPET